VIFEFGFLTLLRVGRGHIHPQPGEQHVETLGSEGAVQVFVGDQMNQFLFGEAFQYLVRRHLERHRVPVLEP